LVDHVKPGDRISVTGVYKNIISSYTKTNGVFKQAMIATNITVMNDKRKNYEVDADIIKQFHKVSKLKNLFDRMSASVAPSI